MKASLDKQLETIMNDRRNMIWGPWLAATFIACVAGVILLYLSDDFDDSFAVPGLCSIGLSVLLVFCMLFNVPNGLGKALVRKWLKIKERRSDRAFLRNLRVKF